jgi:hypothetical protein
MSPATNPYAPPKHADAAPVVSAEAAMHEATRREFLNAETNVRTVGFLVYIGAFACLANGLASIMSGVLSGNILIAAGAGLGWAGYRLRRLDPRGRTLYTVIAALLIVGTLATNADNLAASHLGRVFWVVLMVALLWGRKAGVVMTAHYREVVVPATPHIEYKTSPLLIVFGVVLLAVLILLLLSPLY